MQYTGQKSGSSANAIFICNGTASALPDRQTGGQTEVQLQEEADEQTGRQRNRQTSMSAARTVICSVLVLQLAHTVVNLSGTSSARQTDRPTDRHAFHSFITFQRLLLWPFDHARQQAYVLTFFFSRYIRSTCCGTSSAFTETPKKSKIGSLALGSLMWPFANILHA